MNGRQEPQDPKIAPTPGMSDPEPPAGAGEPPAGDNEAAKYRRRLREVEAERDALKGTLDTVRRGQIEAAIADKLHRPADFFEVGEAVELADLMTEDGQVDTAKVDARLKAITGERPYLVKEPVDTGNTGLPARGVPGADITWKAAIQ